MTNEDLQFTDSIEPDGAGGWVQLDPAAAAFPCGLVAKSVFNDTFEIYKTQVTPANNITIDDSDIAWESDVMHKFKNMQVDGWESKQWLDITNCKYLT